MENTMKLDTSTWKKVKLGDICTIKTGKLNANAAVENGKYPFFTCAEEISRIDTYAFDTDAILISGNGSKLGHIHTYNGKFNAYQRTYVLDKFNINKNYLVQYLKANLPARIKEFVKGGAVPYIVLDCLAEMDVLVPSVEEQIKIANALTTLDNLIEVRGGQRSMIQAQKSQLMTEIFSQKTPREEWKTVKIKDVFDIKRGYVLKASETSKEQTNDYVYPVYSSQTLNDGLMGYWNEYLYENAITWTTDGAYAGTVRYRQGKFYCTNVCGVLIPKVEHIDAKFVSYILGTIAPNHVVKVGNPKLMNNVMAEIEIPLPPLAEQKKIAKILSEYDELIEANDKKSENLRKSRSQLMNSIFTERESLEWNTVKLGDVCTVNSGKGIKKSEYVEDGIYSIIGANGEIGRCNYFNNDKPVLTTGRVGTIGTIQKVNKAWITDNTLIVDIKDSRVTYDFLYYAMGTIDFEKIKTGNAQPLVTAGRLKEVEIKVPNLVEQQRISKVLSDYDSLTFTLDEEIEVLKNTKNQLMNNIFN